jgi:pyruvate dehydrogenase E1 component alpha subunit
MSTADGRLAVLRRMLLIREFEEAVGDRFADDEIPGFVHLSTGQEAVAAGAAAALEADDYVTSTHRGHGHCLARGLDPSTLMAELYGRRTGYCRGKGGSMHAASLDDGMLGAQPIVGAGVPLATGAALTAQVRDEPWVGLSFLGDGAVAEGQVHESINLAATWDLPAIFVVENNHFGEATPMEEQHNVEHLSATAEAYDIPGFTIDGMDVTAVYEAVKEARERAANGEGPTFIEADTYRYEGHFEGDHQPYRTEEDIELWKDRDAIETFKNRLVDAGAVTQEEFEEMREEIDAEIEDAAERAKEADYPDPSEAYEDMFNATVPEINDFAAQMRADGGER